MVGFKGTDTLLRVTPSMLKEHRTRDDAWTSVNGKVYNITPYLPYHPGGEKEIMRVAGRDGSRLFGAHMSPSLLNLKAHEDHARIPCHLQLSHTHGSTSTTC